jgi:tryptophan-rich sensory protein
MGRVGILAAMQDLPDFPKLISPWPLGLAKRLPHAGFSVAVIVAISTLFYFGASGALLPSEHAPFWSSPRQITGMALTYIVILSYLSGFFIYGARRTLEAAAELRAYFVTGEAENLVARLNRVRPLRFWVATGVGVLLGFANIDPRVVTESVGVLSTWPMDLSLVLGSMVVWIFATQVVYVGIENGLTLSRLGRRCVQVDLFQTQRMKPFARVGVRSTLMVMGALAMTPLQALDAQFRAVNYSFAFALGLPVALLLLVLPMWGIHQRLREAKATALASVDASIATAGRDHATDALVHLNALLERRGYLQGLHTWPLDLGGLARVGFYLVIPPLAWVGAALVEMLVQALVDAV